MAREFWKEAFMYLRTKSTSILAISLLSVALAGCDTPVQTEASEVAATDTPTASAEDIAELERLGDDAAAVASGIATDAP